ncbi:MAG: hypothetical protein JO250_03735 [Armatimonadetes bacterium]|nr:hypothetical protein [Armatimonadota bacterium]
MSEYNDCLEQDEEDAPAGASGLPRDLLWDERRMRLYRLRGVPCPLCRCAKATPIPDLVWTGVSLACPVGHGWSNPDALRADLVREP